MNITIHILNILLSVLIKTHVLNNYRYYDIKLHLYHLLFNIFRALLSLRIVFFDSHSIPFTYIHTCAFVHIHMHTTDAYAMYTYIYIYIGIYKCVCVHNGIITINDAVAIILCKRQRHWETDTIYMFLHNLICH